MTRRQAEGYLDPVPSEKVKWKTAISVYLEAYDGDDEEDYPILEMVDVDCDGKVNEYQIQLQFLSPLSKWGEAQDEVVRGMIRFMRERIRPVDKILVWVRCYDLEYRDPPESNP